MLRLMEEQSGTGQLEGRGPVLQVRYQIARYQGFSGSGMPVPGVFKLEGSLDLSPAHDPAALVGADLTLRLEDGRLLRITVADRSGRVLSEGHGPSRCLCC
jgi:hypothetical protein